MDRNLDSLRIRLFGGFDIHSQDGHTVPLAGRKVRGLLACLALSPGSPWSRERLIALLWSDRGEEQARASLRQALAEVRRALGDPSPLRAERDALCLDPAMITVDVIAFERLARTNNLAQAVELYRGPLLADHGIRDDAFEEWLRGERTRLHNLAIDLLDRLTASQSGDAAIQSAQQLLSLDPAREETHRALMRLYAAAGRRTLALRQYQQCREALQRELQAEPDVETERLHRHIQEEKMPIPATRTETAQPDRAPSPSGKPSIAVLPFENMRGDSEQQYFSDGITEDIITELSRFRELYVLARHASFRFRGATVDVRQVGKELGVQYVVEGSVRTLGGRIRITAQLIDAATGNHVWADRYDRDQDEIFAMQDQVVRTVVGTLVGRVAADRAELAKRKPPASLMAYDYVLRGRALAVGDAATELQARRMYEKAIELDPTYGLAHSMLAYTFVNEWGRDLSGSTEALDRALVLARNAVEYDYTSSDCCMQLAWTYLVHRDFDLAEKYYQRALELNPNNPMCFSGMAEWFVYVGRPDEAARWFEQAIEVDPHFNPPWWWRTRGIGCFAERKYGEALAAFNRSAIIPDWVHAYMAACCAHMEANDEARRHAAETLRLEPAFTIAWFLTTEPLKLEADRRHLIEGLRKAGLPE